MALKTSIVDMSSIEIISMMYECIIKAICILITILPRFLSVKNSEWRTIC